MKRLILLVAGAAALAASIRYAKRRRPVHAVELAGPDVIIDEVIVHFDAIDYDDARWDPTGVSPRTSLA